MIACRPTSPRYALEWLSALALASTLLGAPTEARAGDGMVGGEFALKGQVTSTVGPNGATGQPASVLSFTDEEIKKLRAGHYSVALLLQTSSDWADAVTLGAQDELKALGIETAGLSNSNFSASDQAHAVETVLAKNPSGIVIWPINPDELRPALRKASDAGVKLALISNMPSGFRQGRDYVGLVGDDLFAMGQKTAEKLAKAIGEEGDIGFLYFDANAYVVNQRDAAFRTTIEKEFPKIKIAATLGFSDPAHAYQVASAMILQNPNLKAIYAPWSEPAAGVLEAGRTAHRTDIAIGTMDLSNTMAVSLVQGGAVKALTVDDPYSIGKSLVAEIGYSLLGKTAPAYIQAPAISVTNENILDAYSKYYHAAPPPEVHRRWGSKPRLQSPFQSTANVQIGRGDPEERTLDAGRFGPMTDLPTGPGSGLTDRHVFRWTDLTVYLGFVLVFAFFAVTLHDKGFLSTQNATSIISQVTPIALMAFGSVFVLTAGEIDLSIGSVVAMSALFTALGLRHFGLPAGNCLRDFDGTWRGPAQRFPDRRPARAFVPDHARDHATVQRHRTDVDAIAGRADHERDLHDLVRLRHDRPLVGCGGLARHRDRCGADRLSQSRLRLARHGDWK